MDTSQQNEQILRVVITFWLSFQNQNYFFVVSNLIKIRLFHAFMEHNT